MLSFGPSVIFTTFYESLQIRADIATFCQVSSQTLSLSLSLPPMSVFLLLLSLLFYFWVTITMFYHYY